MSNVHIAGISSMATRQLLLDIAAAYEQHAGVVVAIESVGGVDAAKRVRAGEAFDIVILAADVIDELIAAGHMVAGSRVDVTRSGIAVAVRTGAMRPDIASEQAVKDAAQRARRIGLSTGPSGTYLKRLFESWGIAGEREDRIVTAPPGVPVGSLVASGEVELGFQQLSELIHQSGIDVVGPLPPAIQSFTTFSGALCTRASRPDAARAALAFVASPACEDYKRRQGMEPA
jgi:molybdate transport system substrate-binding protein